MMRIKSFLPGKRYSTPELKQERPYIKHCAEIFYEKPVYIGSIRNILLEKTNILRDIIDYHLNIYLPHCLQCGLQKPLEENFCISCNYAENEDGGYTVWICKNIFYPECYCTSCIAIKQTAQSLIEVGEFLDIEPRREDDFPLNKNTPMEITNRLKKEEGIPIHPPLTLIRRFHRDINPVGQWE